MRGFDSRALALGAAALLAACAHAPNRPLGEPRPELEATQVVAVVRQEKIYAVTVDRSKDGVAEMWAAAGLIGALIAQAAKPDIPKDQVKFDPAAAPVVDFGAGLQDAFEASAAPAWLGSLEATVASKPTESELDAALRRSSAGATMFVFADYHLKQTLRSLVVTAVPALYLRGQRYTKNLATAEYYNTVTVEVTGLTDWSGSGGAQLKRAIRYANGVIPELVFADLTSLAPGRRRMAEFKDFGIGKAYRTSTGALRLSVDVDSTPALPRGG